MVSFEDWREDTKDVMLFSDSYDADVKLNLLSGNLHFYQISQKAYYILPYKCIAN